MSPTSVNTLSSGPMLLIQSFVLLNPCCDRTKSAMLAVWGIACAAFVMGLTLLQGAAAFNTCSSIASAGLCIDYALPVGFRAILARSNFEPGPFTLGR